MSRRLPLREAPLGRGSRGLLALFLVASACSGKPPAGCPAEGTDGECDLGAASVPSAVDFGMATLGAQVQRSLPLTNTGAGPLAITGQALQGDTTQSFRLLVPYPAALGAGATAAAVIQFFPTQSGPLSAQLALTTNGAPASLAIALTGAGLASCVTATPAADRFRAGPDRTAAAASKPSPSRAPAARRPTSSSIPAWSFRPSP